MTAILSGPCTCLRFLLLLAEVKINPGAWQKLLDHMDDCEACQWWHSQPAPEQEEEGE